MKILGLIPARGGSKGIPNKNIKLLAGKPLIQYTSAAALGTKKLSKVVLSTDDPAIAEVGERLGLIVPFMRPQELANDISPTLPVIQHVLKFFEAKGEFYDAICLLQPTSPFRTSRDIDLAISTFELSNTDSLISVLPVPHTYNPHWTFEPCKETGRLKISTGETTIIPRRQDLPQAYHRDGSIYLTKANVILHKNSIYGDSIGYYISSIENHVNIDTMEDWEMAEQILERKIGYKNE